MIIKIIISLYVDHHLQVNGKMKSCMCMVHFFLDLKPSAPPNKFAYSSTTVIAPS